MTCCIGKARIYYKEPLHYKLNYSGSTNGSVTAPEPLTTSYIGEMPGQIPNILYRITVQIEYRTNGSSLPFNAPSPGVRTNQIGAISNFILSSTGDKFAGAKWVDGTGRNRSITFASTSARQGYEIRNAWYTIERMDGLPPKYIFKVIGTETGTVYQEIGGLDESPAVENLGCVMGEEKYIDVEMGDMFKPFDPILTPWLPDCIVSVNLFNSIQINKRKVAIPLPLTTPIINLPKIEGCPDPTYRVECFPDGSTDPRERCPPDTDCSLDCGSFICCYKNGRVIRTVQK